MTEVWVVERQGVYRQGIALIATSREEAEAFVTANAPDTDGYHDWVVTPIKLGEPIEDTFVPREQQTRRRPTDGDLKVEWEE